MLKNILIIILFGISISTIPLMSQTINADYINIDNEEGDGIKFLNSNSYKISAGNSSQYLYGPVTNYSIKNTVPYSSTRGWTWGGAGSTPKAALSSYGKLQIASDFKTMSRTMYLGDYQKLYGDNSSALYFNSNNSSYSQMIFRDKENKVYGRVCGYLDGAQFGLKDADGSWSYLAVKDNYTDFRINNSTKMRIKSDGTIGIGTTSPKTKLHVYGEGAFGSSSVYYLKLGSTGTTSYLDKNGPGSLQFKLNGSTQTTLTTTGFGIGTTAPKTKLHVYGEGSFGASPTYYLTLGSSGTTSYINKKGSGNIQFRLNNSTKMTLNNNGFGIGTTDPQSKFHVDGQGRFGTNNDAIKLGFGGQNSYIDKIGMGDFHFRIDGSNKMALTNNGLGIGTDSPNYELEVNGTGRFKEVIVETANWPDFVFDDNYQLMSLEEKIKYIEQFKHLPSLGSANEVQENGLKIQSTLKGLTQELEETLLYSAELNSKVKSVEKITESLKEENELLKKMIQNLSERLAKLESE